VDFAVIESTHVSEDGYGAFIEHLAVEAFG